MWLNLPSSGKRHAVLKCFLVLSAVQISVGQYFDPELDDKTYLDNLQKRIETEVKDTREELIVQAQIVELMTKQFVAAQLKENLFIALRVLAEKELSQLGDEKTNAILLLAMANEGETTTEVSQPEINTNDISESTTIPSLSKEIQLIPRQDDDDDDDNGGGGAGGVGGATTVRASDTAQFQQGLIPQVANLIKAIFGGNQNINLTNYVTGATKLLPKPVGTQVVGLVSSLSVPSYQNQAGGAGGPGGNIKGPLPGAPGYRPNQQYPPGYNPNGNQVPGSAGFRPNQVPGAPGYRPNQGQGAPGYRPNQIQGAPPGYRPNQVPGQGGNYQQNQGPVGSPQYRPNGVPGGAVRPNQLPGGGIRPNQVPGSSQLSEYKPNQIAAPANGRPGAIATTRPYQINQSKGPGGNGIQQNNVQNFQQAPQLQPGQIGNVNRRPPSNPVVNNQSPDSGSFSNTFNSVQQLGTRPTTLKPYIYNPTGNRGTTRPGFQGKIPQYQINQQYLQQQQLQQQQQQQQQQFQQSQFQQAFPPQQQFQQPQNQFVPQQQFSQQQQQQFNQQQQPIRPQQGGPFAGNRPNPNGGNQRPTTPTEEDEDEDEDEDGRKRQFNLESILGLLKPTQAPKVIPPPMYVNAAAAPGCSNTVPIPTTYAATTSTGTANRIPAQVAVGQVPIQAGQIPSQIVVTQTGATGATQPQLTGTGTCLADPSDVSSIMMAQGFNLGTFANDVGKSFRDIIRVMPDIFRGAREGVQLLQTLSSVLGGLDGFSLGDIF